MTCGLPGALIRHSLPLCFWSCIMHLFCWYKRIPDLFSISLESPKCLYHLSCLYILNHSLQPPKTKHKHPIRIHAMSPIQIFTSIHLSKSNQCKLFYHSSQRSNYGIFCINEPPIYTTTTPQRNPFVHMTIIRFVINKWDVPMHYYELNTINRWIYW